MPKLLVAAGSSKTKKAIASYRQKSANQSSAKESSELNDVAKNDLSGVPLEILNDRGYEVVRQDQKIIIESKSYDETSSGVESYLQQLTGKYDVSTTQSGFVGPDVVLPAVIRYRSIIDLDNLTMTVNAEILDRVGNDSVSGSNGRLVDMVIDQSSPLKMSQFQYNSGIKNTSKLSAVNKATIKRMTSFLSGKRLMPVNQKMLLPFYNDAPNIIAGEKTYGSFTVLMTSGYLAKDRAKTLVPDNATTASLPNDLVEKLRTNGNSNGNQWPSEYVVQPITLTDDDLAANVMDIWDVGFGMGYKILAGNQGSFGYEVVSTEPVVLRYITDQYNAK